VITFGDVEIDVPGREVRRAGKTVHLEPQAFDLLVVLVQHRDRVLSKNELLDGVWGHRFVSEANLTTRIKEIRRAVGDDGTHQHTIKNIRGRGYRFVADVTDPEHAGRRAIAPAPPTLTGRDQQVASVCDAFALSPAVTLTGPAGVGKSTLARAVGERIGPTLDDGLHLVELSTLASEDDVLPAVARALGIVFDIDRQEHAIRSIAEREMLLVLDNCEHVVDATAALIDRVLATGGARTRVLATSQVRLGLSVERVVAVEPLDTRQALALFTERACAVRPSWRVDDIGTDRVTALLTSLDLLPLTIEMAAARLGSMTFDELEAAIGDGTPLAQMSHRSPVRRHRSLDSLVSWSAELLEPADRQLFTEFSVFSGAVSAADAAAVIRPDHPSAVMFGLGALAERSLLVADDDGETTRYRMLFTVRTVANDWLERTEHADEVRGRHAEHFTRAVAVIDLQIRTPDEAQGRRRLDDIIAEVRSAHGWARGHRPSLAADLSGALHLAAYSSFWNEPVEWSRMLLDQHEAADGPDLDGARLVVGGADANSGQLEAARDALAPQARSSDARVRATALEILSDVAIYAGDLDEVEALTEALRQVGTELGDPHAIAISAVNASLASAYAGHADRALDRIGALDLASLSPSDRAWVAYTRGEALSAAGDPEAVRALTEAIDIADTIGNPFVTSVAALSLGTEYARAGDHHKALETFAGCLHDYARHGNFVHATTTLRNLVEVLVAVGDDHGAAVLAGAMSDARLRPSYGAETARLGDVIAAIEQRIGSPQFDEWSTEGQQFDVQTAVRVAAEIVERHRR